MSGVPCASCALVTSLDSSRCTGARIPSKRSFVYRIRLESYMICPQAVDVTRTTARPSFRGRKAYYQNDGLVGSRRPFDSPHREEA